MAIMKCLFQEKNIFNVDPSYHTQWDSKEKSIHIVVFIIGFEVKKLSHYLFEYNWNYLEKFDFDSTWINFFNVKLFENCLWKSSYTKKNPIGFVWHTYHCRLNRFFWSVTLDHHKFICVKVSYLIFQNLIYPHTRTLFHFLSFSLLLRIK